jgi:hypothetical protein
MCSGIWEMEVSRIDYHRALMTLTFIPPLLAPMGVPCWSMVAAGLLWVVLEVIVVCRRKMVCEVKVWSRGFDLAQANTTSGSFVKALLH